MTAILRVVADWFTGSVEAELTAARAELAQAKQLHESDLRKLDAARIREAALEGTVRVLRDQLAETRSRREPPTIRILGEIHEDCTPAPERERLLVQLGWCRKQLADRGITTWPPPVKVGA